MLLKKTNWVNPDPKFPPAPVRPDMIPSERRDIKGMMPKVAPHADCAPMEKRIIAVIARGRELARPNHMQNKPPKVCKVHRVHSLPLIPNFRAAKSEANPPAGLATKLAIPNVAAIIPAV